MTTRHASDPEERLRIGEAARLLQVSVETLRRWSAKGHLPCERRPSGDRVYRRGDVEAMISRPAPAQPDEPSAAAAAS